MTNIIRPWPKKLPHVWDTRKCILLIYGQIWDLEKSTSLTSHVILHLVDHRLGNLESFYFLFSKILVIPTRMEQQNRVRPCLYGEKLAWAPEAPSPRANFTGRLHGKNVSRVMISLRRIRTKPRCLVRMRRRLGYDELPLSMDWNISVRMLCVTRLGPASLKPFTWEKVG